MAEPLKNFFDGPRVRVLAGLLSAAEPGFPVEAFVADATRGLDTLELMDRGKHIADTMARALGADKVRALDLLVRALQVPVSGTLGSMGPFLYLPFTFYVSEHAVEHPEPALDAQHAITKRFSCEFSIRAFIERWPELTFARLRVWVDDPDAHVRRLVSEGTRPRLPWGRRLRALQADPTPMLPLLERLRDDPSEYVRRSVANHLNDIGKDHPALLVEVSRAWLVDAPPERVALVKHAIRDRVKKGDRDAIALLGAGGGTFTVRADLPATAELGGSLPVVVHVENVGATASRAVVDLAVVFPGSGEKGRRKVFKLATVELAPGARATLRKSISLRDHTTRRALPGEHVLAAQIDGALTPLGSVSVA